MNSRTVSEHRPEVPVRRSATTTIIGGKWVAPIAGKYFDNISPVTGQLVCEIARSDAPDIEAALDAAHAAKDAWGRTAPAERAQHPQQDRRPDGGEPRAARARRDLGQRQADPRDDARPTSRSPSTISAISPACIRAQEGSISEIDHDTVAYHFHEPLGVVGQIIPWNFPLLMAVLEARAGARRRQLRRAQARRADPGLDHGAGPSSSAICCRRACSTSSTASASRPASRSPPARASPRSPSPARRRPAG